MAIRIKTIGLASPTTTWGVAPTNKHGPSEYSTQDTSECQQKKPGKSKQPRLLLAYARPAASIECMPFAKRAAKRIGVEQPETQRYDKKGAPAKRSTKGPILTVEYNRVAICKDDELMHIGPAMDEVQAAFSSDRHSRNWIERYLIAPAGSTAKTMSLAQKVVQQRGKRHLSMCFYETYGFSGKQLRLAHILGKTARNDVHRIVRQTLEKTWGRVLSAETAASIDHSFRLFKTGGADGRRTMLEIGLSTDTEGKSAGKVDRFVFDITHSPKATKALRA